MACREIDKMRTEVDIGVSRDMGILAAGNPSGSRLECMYVRSKSTPFRKCNSGKRRTPLTMPTGRCAAVKVRITLQKNQARNVLCNEGATRKTHTRLISGKIK